MDYVFYGITQDPKTKNYMMVLNDICKNCKSICNVMYFQQKFNEWTSDNDNIDKLIQETQLSAHNNTDKALEWIPYQRFKNFNYIKKDEFGKVYKAKWIDGKISYWDVNNQSWNRKNPNMIVTLKSLNNSKNITLDFMNEVRLIYYLIKL